MVGKKHALYKLEKKRNSFLAIGFMLSLFIVLTAMEWKTSVFEEDDIACKYPIDIGIEVTPPILIVCGPKKPPFRKTIHVLKPVVDGEGEVQEKEYQDEYIEADSINIPDEDEDWGVIPAYPKPPTSNPDIMPQFKNGEKDRMTYLIKHTKYPDIAVIGRVEGTVYVSMIISPKGEVQQVKLKKGIGSGCDEEVLRVVSNMPRWKPGRMGKHKVAVSQIMKFEFVLPR